MEENGLLCEKKSEGKERDWVAVGGFVKMTANECGTGAQLGTEGSGAYFPV